MNIWLFKITYTHIVKALVACTAACIQLVFILTLSFVYRRLAVVLTNWELWPTRSEYNNALTVKLFMLQFANYYSVFFYVAYLKGRCVRYPYLLYSYCTGNISDQYLYEYSNVL